MTEPGNDAAVRGRSPGRDWVRVSHGLYGAVDAEDSDLRAWQLLLPRAGCFTHLTAAGIREWWLPPLPRGLPVFVAVGRNDVRPARTGIRTIRPARSAPHEVVRELRVAAVVDVLLACARDLSLLDLVVLIDAALHAGDITLDDLRSALAGRSRGAPALRLAADWAHPKSESAWETLLRVFHRVCGIDVEPQHELREDGRTIARGDLWLVGTRMFHEYDGGDHLPRRQQVKDLRRMRALDATAWQRRGYTSEDLLHRAVGILRDADRSLGRTHEPDRIRAWHALLRESLFTPLGQRRVMTRLGLDAAA